MEHSLAASVSCKAHPSLSLPHQQRPSACPTAAARADRHIESVRRRRQRRAVAAGLVGVLRAHRFDARACPACNEQPF